MKVVILAGGFGTRISEESHLRPKPMIEIGGQPILWHIMKIYSSYGFHEFIICAGYKQQIIKEYFANYYLHRSDVTFDFADGGHMTVHNNVSEPWKVTIVDTGYNTMTGGRVKRIAPYIGDEDFFLTYGDGVSDVPIDRLLRFHREKKKIVTITAVNPGQRFGTVELDSLGVIRAFREKKEQDGGLINGGFMVASPELLRYIDGDDTFLEREPMERLSAKRQIAGYVHQGFWRCMDTQRDKEALEELWAGGHAPWKTWK